MKSWFACVSELLNSADVKTSSCFHLWPKRSQLTWAVNRIPWSCGSEGLCHLWNLLEPLKHPLRPEMPREPLCSHNISTPWMYKARNKRTQLDHNGLLSGAAWISSCDIYFASWPCSLCFILVRGKRTDSRKEQYKVHSTQCIYIYMSLYLVNRCKQMYLYLSLSLLWCQACLGDSRW